jgi:hypothetical protein
MAARQDTPEPRAEELLVEIYRQKRAAIDEGRVPQRVILNRTQYDVIQAYHARLGEMPDGQSDYIGRYELFELEICIERVVQPVVE